MHQQRLQQLFTELSAALVLYARQWTGYPDDAVQEAFIDLANCPELPDSPKAWLYTATRRKAQNIARSETRRRRHQQHASETSSGWFDESLDAIWPAEDVQHALETLADDERELVVARIWGELNFEQLAELLTCSTSSAHRRYTAALSKLKNIMTKNMQTEEHDLTHASQPSRPSTARPTKFPNQVSSRASKERNVTSVKTVGKGAELANGESP